MPAAAAQQDQWVDVPSNAPKQDDEWKDVPTAAPAPKETEQPGFFARASERLVGTQHPVDQAVSEAEQLYHHPGQALEDTAKQVGKTLAIDMPNALLHPVRATGGPEFAQDVANKNWAGAAGTIAGDVLPFLVGSPEVREAATELPGKTAETVGRVARTEEGNLRPIVRTASRAAGAAGGSALAGPFGGAAGAVIGPDVADTILPNRRPGRVATPKPVTGLDFPYGPEPAPPIEAKPLGGGKATKPPNAAGQVETTGLRTSPQQAVISPKEPVRTIGDRTLPPGPKASEPTVGKIADTHANGARATAGIAPQPINPQEVADLGKQFPGRVIGTENVNELLRTQAADKNVSEGLAGRRGDEISTAREIDRAAMERQSNAGKVAPAGPTVETIREGYQGAGPKESTAKQVGKLASQAYGVEPLKPDVPLRDQVGKMAETPKKPLEEKYPDKTVRQMVHANGERIVDAVGNDPALMRQIHDITAVDLRQAMINADIDMGQKIISSKKAMGEGAIPRSKAFEMLLDKGHSPSDIVQLAKPSPKDVIEGAGLKYKGEVFPGAGVHQFEDPAHPDETATLRTDEISPEAVKAKMASKLKEFRKPKP